MAEKLSKVTKFITESLKKVPRDILVCCVGAFSTSLWTKRDKIEIGLVNQTPAVSVDVIKTLQTVYYKLRNSYD